MNHSKIIGILDHTLLKADATTGDIQRHCRKAVQYGFATVALNPYNAPLAATCLKDSPVGICVAIGFPLGAQTLEVKLLETRQAIKDGATDVDMVINIGALKSGDCAYVKREIDQFVQIAKGRAISKIILETCLLSQDEKRRACQWAAESGADFVKTSTGFQSAGATVDDVRLMKQAVGNGCQVKAAGGIQSLEVALKMVEAGATRIGTSASVAIAESILRQSKK